MAQYFFHLFNDEQAIDLDGMELPSTLTAYDHARNMARILATECIKERGRLFMGHRIEVCDEHGRKILTVNFSDVMIIDR